ncbi:MAG: Ig-like domain-containing protein [Archangium sp.]|nr:Ig-like domain-containing protein [Archangium sp.]
MTRWSCAVAVVCLMACNEKPVPGGSCGGEACGEGQRCDASTLHCVTNGVPKLTLVAPATVISDASFVISGTVADDTADTVLAWRDGVGEWQALEASDGKFSFAVPARDLDAAPMYLTVRADDATTQVEASTLVIVDRVGPRFELKAPLSVAGGRQATVTIVARDGSEGLQDLSIAGQNIPSPRTGTELSAQVAIPTADRTAIPVAVVAKDLNGNRTTQTFMVQVDGAGPSLRFVSPTAQTPVTNVAAYRVQVEAIDLSGVQQLRVAMDDGGFVAAVEQDGGVWAAEVPMPLAERTVSFSAEAVDVAGNVSLVGSAPLGVDRIAPTVQVTGPSLDSVPDGVLFVNVMASADAVSVSATFAGNTAALSKEAGEWQGQVPFTMTGDHLPQFIVAMARDAAGNLATSAPHRQFIDTVAPTLTFITPAANAKLNRTDFTGTDEVIVSWQVQDGDPQAATVSVDGAWTTANQVRITTQPGDDGRSITTTVLASDSGGNLVTGSITFSVDRVAPTILSWLPAANARNVEPRTTTVSFSERVTGPTSSTEALTFTPTVTQPGTWNAAHSSWTSAALPPYAVFTATLGNLADDSGNPVDVSSRRFHTAALAAATGSVLATGVTGFDVVSDADGVVTVAVTTASGFRVFGLSPVTGAVEAPLLTEANGGLFHLNASLTVDPVTLVATHRVGSARYGGVGGGPLPLVGLVRHGITNGVASPLGGTADASGAVISQAAFAGEGDSSPFALINGSSYQRGALNRPLATSPHLLVAQSNGTWAAFSTSAAGLSWSRFLCIPNPITGASTCTSFSFSAASAEPSDVRAALTPGGRCLVASWKTGSTRAALFQQLAGCDEPRPVGSPPHPSCQNNQVVTPVVVGNRLRVAPFSGNGENTILAAYDTGSGLQLGKLTSPAACTNAFSPVGPALPNAATAFEPVQLGNRPALLYTDAGRNLKLYAP